MVFRWSETTELSSLMASSTMRRLGFFFFIGFSPSLRTAHAAAGSRQVRSRAGPAGPQRGPPRAPARSAPIHSSIQQIQTRAGSRGARGAASAERNTLARTGGCAPAGSCRRRHRVVHSRWRACVLPALLPLRACLRRGQAVDEVARESCLDSPAHRFVPYDDFIVPKIKKYWICTKYSGNMHMMPFRPSLVPFDVQLFLFLRKIVPAKSTLPPDR